MRTVEIWTGTFGAHLATDPILRVTIVQRCTQVLATLTLVDHQQDVVQTYRSTYDKFEEEPGSLPTILLGTPAPRVPTHSVHPVLLLPILPPSTFGSSTVELEDRIPTTTC